MKRYAYCLAAVSLALVCMSHHATVIAAAPLTEKEKAMANPYPNDLGPAELDKETLDSYPPNIQKGYQLMRGVGDKKNCQSCHTAARPLNSRFVELAGATAEERDAKVAALKKEHPEYFSDYRIRQIEGSIWNRYVKRMMSKPGCDIDKATGKQIWEFLEYDGMHRKLGANAAKWEAHQKDLLKQFQEKYPDRYKQLDSEHDL